MDVNPELRDALLRRQGHTYESNVFEGSGPTHVGDVAFESNVISGSGPTQLGHIYGDVTNHYIIRRSTADHGVPTTSDSPLGRHHDGALPKLADRDALYWVPRNSDYRFTGRKSQLDQISQCFSESKPPRAVGRHKIAVLVGLGGSGKTEVSLRYAELNRNSYWGVFWVDGSNKTSIEAAYAYLGQQAGVGPTATSGQYWLSQRSQRGKKWLLILDNVDDLQMDIAEYFPSGDTGYILITTRHHEIRMKYANVGHVDFGEMDPQEATELLLRTAFTDACAGLEEIKHRSTAERIAEVLGYLAIALNLAGSTIRRKIYTIEEYLQHYLGNRDHLLNSKYSIPSEVVSVVTTWEIPFKQVEQNNAQEYQDAVVLICIFAFLHFDSISEALLRSVQTDGTKKSPWVDQLPDLFTSISTRRLRRAIIILAERSIINYSIPEGSETGVCSLHPVVHDWVKSRMDSTDKLKFWLKRTMCLLSCCNPETFKAAHGMSILPHVNYCLYVVDMHAPELLETKQGMYEAEVFASMYAANGAWPKSSAILKKVTENRLRIQGWWHEDTLQAQRSLAVSLYSMFEIEAALKIQSKVYATRWVLRNSLLDYLHPWRPIHIPYLTILDDMTQSLWLADRREESRRAGQSAVEGFVAQVGYNDPRTWSAMLNFGRTLITTGELEKGHELILFVVRKRKDRFGKNHAETLMAWNELGMSYLARRKFPQLAYWIISNVYAARKEVLGRDHAYTLWSANDLSRVLVELKRFDEAIDLLEKTIPKVELVLGTDHIGMALTKGNLARTFAISNDWSKADVVISGLMSTMNEEHPQWVQYSWGYARIKVEANQANEAEATCLKILERLKNDNTKGSPPPYRFRVFAELLGYIYHHEGQTEQLAALWRQYSWMKEEHVKQPPSVLTLSQNL